MALTEDLRKVILAVEVQALFHTLSGTSGSIDSVPPEFSRESLVKLPMEELATLKEDLRDAVRSLGGGRQR